MRLATYDDGTGPRAGLITSDDHVHDAAALLGTGPLHDVGALLEHPNALERLRDTDLGAGRPLAEVRLRAPLLRPPSIRDHIAFEGHASRTGTRDLPDVWHRRSLYYYSGVGRIHGPEDIVPMPLTERLDYELEIAAVIARDSSDVAYAEAMDVIAGFTLFNDWSARDLQADEMAYGLGPSKGKDFGSSFGPWVVTTDELAPHLVDGRLDLDVTVRVNGQTWATSNSRAMAHSWPAMVEHASYDGRLLAGDLLGSGTVDGCSIGEALRVGTPGVRYLRPGDHVELAVAGIGVLANTIGEPSKRPAPAGFRPPALPPMPAPPDS
ncbi:fumarylacetoacetate hydrolase family protein [Streptomyces sp. NPDC050625]|uniref:fumarylacetoacetate hydrolase family protein n=1 Tax=Streptomyces sp. NPDC050625 TaxID=3154629 RepID=UPI00341D74EE